MSEEMYEDDTIDYEDRREYGLFSSAQVGAEETYREPTDPRELHE